MKTVFSTDTHGRVTMTYTDVFGDRRSRTFTCPDNGGYVIEMFPGGDTRQVCDRLAAMGSTLTCGSRANLLALIRREYRAMRASWKRA